MYKNDKINAYISAVFFSLLVGFSFLGIKVCQQFANELEILTYRYNFAFIAASIAFGIKKYKDRYKKEEIEKRPKKGLLLASVSYIGFMIFQVIGIFYTTSVLGAIIFSITPIIVQMIAGRILKEKTNIKQNVFIAISVSSNIYMIWMGARNFEFDIIGGIFLIIASLLMAISNVSMRYIRRDYTPLEITFYICAIGFVIFNVVTVVVNIKNGTSLEYFRLIKNHEFLLATGYLGIGCIFITSQLISFMLSKLEAIKATIFGNLSTAISIFAGISILSEPVLAYHIVSAAGILIGVIGVSIYGNK